MGSIIAKPRRTGHEAVPAAHRERDRVPAAARPRSAPLPGQELPHRAGPKNATSIGQAHRSFRFDLRYRALLGGTRDQLEQQIKDGFPFLPAGCSLQLDRVSSERVLANLRESLPSRRPQLLAEARRLGRCSLAGLLEGLGMELGEFYQVAGSWALLQRELGWVARGGPQVSPRR